MKVKKRSQFRFVKEWAKERSDSFDTTVYKIKGGDDFQKIVHKAVIDNRPICVVTDYDCDGIFSAYILHEGLTKYISENNSQSSLNLRFPRRQSEGYGIKIGMLNDFPENALIITADNGIAAVDAIKEAKRRGFSVIVTDHHLANADGILPPADLIIDPNAIEGQCPFTGYCGAGIAYKMVCELFETEEIPELKPFAAIATVADMVPMISENHELCKTAKNAIKYNSGIECLCNALCIKLPVDEDIVGFSIGPAINAAGRLLDRGAEDSFQLLTSNDEDILRSRAFDLSTMNEIRKNETSRAMDLINSSLDGKCLNKFILIKGDFHEGLAGLIAGKITEKYHRPAIVLSGTGNYIDGFEVYKGSARTYGANHIKNILDHHKEYLLGYGGHAAAAGLSIREDKISEFDRAIQDDVIAANEEILGFDLEFYKKSNVMFTYSDQSKAAPYGVNNEKPVYLLRNIQVKNYIPMGIGRKHVQIVPEIAEDLPLYEIMAFDEYKKVENLGFPETISVLATLGLGTDNKGKIVYQFQAIEIDTKIEIM